MEEAPASEPIDPVITSCAAGAQCGRIKVGGLDMLAFQVDCSLDRLTNVLRICHDMLY